MTDGRAEGRDALIARAYGPDGTPAGVRALAEFDHAAAAAATATAERGAGSASAAADDVEGPQDESRETASPSRWSSPRRRILRLSVLGLVIVALLCGAFAIGRGAAPRVVMRAGAEVPTETVEHPNAPRSELPAIERTLPAFEQPEGFSSQQTPVDVPDATLPPSLVRSSFRAAGFDTAGLPTSSKIYVAKNTSRAVCLVAVHSGSVSSVCVSSRYFPASGLSLTWTDTGFAFTASWMLDGTISLDIGR